MSGNMNNAGSLDNGNHFTNSKQNLSFMDAAWLQTYGLSRDNILDYFYLSPFYDSNSNNQIIRAQRVPIHYLFNMVGIEYMIDNTNTASYEPTLFIIKKQNRRSATSVDILEIFYIMEGIIYQCPTFINLLIIKYNKINLYLNHAFYILLNNKEMAIGKDDDEADKEDEEGEEDEGGEEEESNYDHHHHCLTHSSVQQYHQQQRSTNYTKIREMPSITSTLDDLETMFTELQNEYPENHEN